MRSKYGSFGLLGIIGGLLLFGLISRASHTNVVIILCDDVGFECFGSYGSEEYYTPRLDTMAEEGIRFTNVHSTPLCTPSRVNLMTGKSNVFNYYDFGVFPREESTFAQHFKSLGYATAVAGKWQLQLEDKGITPTDAGFDTYCLWNMPLTSRERYWNPSFDKNGSLIKLPKDSYGPKVVNDFIIEFIKENKDRPFMVYNPLILPHSPFPPTPHSKNLKETDEKKNFIDMVEYIDFVVGRLVDNLEELGLRENTLILFTSDNGTHDRIISELDGKQIPGRKGYTKDYGTRVPLIVNFPGVIPGGQVNEDLICFSDIFPTIVEAARIKPKRITDGDGWSFWPQCLGQNGIKREWIYGYYFPRPYAEDFDDKYRHWEVRYARDKRYKLYDSGKMYDTVIDTLEKSPLAEETAQEVRKKLQDTLNTYPPKGQNVDYSRVTGTMPEGIN